MITRTVRKLNRLQITIETPNYDTLGDSFISVKVNIIVNNQKYSYQEELLPDDMASLFDKVFDLAKFKLKEIIILQSFET